jgi:4-oxalomesaconate hydratase
MSDKPTLLYIGAHDVDFLVRAGGTMAKYARRGSRVVGVSLTYGERQESARLWRERPGITIDEVKQVRREESLKCAELIGVEAMLLDWDDCPIDFTKQRLLEIARIIREVRPDILITHWLGEKTNFDHATTAQATLQAAMYSGAAGALLETGLAPWSPSAIYLSEPTFPFPDRNEFNPNVYVDITDEYEAKLAGLRTAWSHGRLDQSYPLCASFRGYQASLLAHDPAIKYAEAFICERKWVGDSLPFVS